MLEMLAWRLVRAKIRWRKSACEKPGHPNHGILRFRSAYRFLAAPVYARYQVERIYREVRFNAIGGGSEEIMKDLASRQMGL